MINRPLLYATLLPRLCAAARHANYGLGIHGSLQRDLDLIAVPWTEDAWPTMDFVNLMVKESTGQLVSHRADGIMLPPEQPALKPHGRKAWKIGLGPDGSYIDLSVMPLFGEQK